MRHSSLRNVVERIFGVCRRRFPLLVRMSSFKFPFLCILINCAFVLHNFIHINQKCHAVAGNYAGHIIPDTLYTVTENTG